MNYIEEKQVKKTGYAKKKKLTKKKKGLAKKYTFSFKKKKV